MNKPKARSSQIICHIAISSDNTNTKTISQHDATVNNTGHLQYVCIQQTIKSD